VLLAFRDAAEAQGRTAVNAAYSTHPHTDHTDGLLQLIDREPNWIGCVATYHADGKNSFELELEGRSSEPRVSDNPLLELALRRVRPLLQRIQDEWDDRPDSKQCLRAGLSLPIKNPRVKVRCVSPDPAGTEAFFSGENIAERVRRNANELSAALEVTFEGIRIVLGADLPEHDNDVGPKTGWTKVLSEFPDLPGSQGLKVPHHGSDGAMHPAMVGPGCATAGSIWIVTPFQGGEHSVPALRDGRGIDALLKAIDFVYLTALPAGWRGPLPTHDGDVPIAEVTPIPPEVGIRSDATDVSLASQSQPSSPVDPAWLFAFNPDGGIARYRGDSAIRLRRASTD
jgi:hypothetical protein